MAKLLVRRASQNLTCPVCFEYFKKPKYLPCHHSYCEECLEKMQVQSKIICPECRKEATVPTGGVKDLDDNFFINNLVDEFVSKRKVKGEADVKCDECCEEDPVVAFCPDCTMFLCDVCSEHHKRSTKFRSHDQLSVLVNGEHIKESALVIRDYRLLFMPRRSLNVNGSLRGPWGTAVSRNGMWTVTDFDQGCVYMFDKYDRLLTTFGQKGSGKGELKHPEGVAFDAHDHVYVADHRNQSIQKYSINGEHLLQFGKGKLFYPRSLTVHNSKVYVTDENNHVSVFQLDGRFFGFIAEGQLGSPRGVAISSDNMLLVADVGHHCIYTFTLDGEYVGRFGSHGSGRGQFKYPYDVAVDLYGFILVADTENKRVQIFDKHHNYIHQFDGCGVLGRCDGIAVSSTGNIYVTDCDNEEIQMFSR